ncbi:MAG: CCA tRNA nucleotidyltransferase [Paracoccaceae bacterium]
MTTIRAPWLRDADTQTVLSVLGNAGAQALAVGGCVRNTLMGLPIKDIDIATDARPEKVMRLARDAGLRAIPTGIDHGTVTVVVNGTAFEVTTFRRDVETDGRHAVVHFADTVEEDAARRDFTMNALYLTKDGMLVDPLGGFDDLQRHYVRFIGDAAERIREDYLRSLRYFRFHAIYGDPEEGFDAEALAGIAKNLDGLDKLSKERVEAEILKLLGADDPAPSVATMRQVGVLARCLPGADDKGLARLVYLESEAGVSPDALRRLALLGGVSPVDDLRLSRADQKRLSNLRDGIGNMQPPGELGYRLGSDAATNVVLLRAASLETDLPDGFQDQITTGATAEFPIKANYLMPNYTGAALGARLDELERAWIASNFTLDRSALMEL